MHTHPGTNHLTPMKHKITTKDDNRSAVYTELSMSSEECLPWGASTGVHVLKQSLKLLGTSLVELFFPRQCAGCQKSWLHIRQGFWCEACQEELPWIAPPICPRCGRPFPKSPSSPDHLCGDCLQSAFLFDSARSATQHSGVVRKRIHQLKFGGRLFWAPPLAELLVDLFRREESAPVDIIFPVPLHVRRLRQRGFNQAGLLAKAFGRRLGLPVLYDVLVRKCWTEPQTRLNREERLKNVRDAFQVLDIGKVKDLSVLIIDDVYTTGTTLNECAKTLKSVGASAVHALTVCRALPDWKTDYAGGTD
jgi:competence protein ComFC